MEQPTNRVSAILTPLAWGATQSVAPVFSRGCEGTSGFLMRRWIGSSPEIAQPSLTQSYIVLHLGGPKRVFRRGEGGAVTVDAALGAISVIPAGAAYAWRTEGPIDFAHLYPSSGLLERVVAQEFQRQWRGVELNDVLGASDELMRALLNEMLSAVQDPLPAPRLYLETLTHALILRLLRAHSTLAVAPFGSRHRLAPHRLRRVMDHIETNLAAAVSLEELAAIAGSSPYHFCRAFAQANGRPPHAYLIHRRVAHARDLLRDTEFTIGEVARRCGFNSARQLSRMFRREMGVSAAAYRRQI